MTSLKILRCPLCRGKFKWDVALNNYPEHCQICREFIGHNRANDDVVSPAIISSRTKVADQTYRDLEKSSDVAAERAAEMIGDRPSEMGMAITNLRDNVRPGESYVAPVVNAVTQRMDAMKSAGIPVGFDQASGAQFAAAVQQGHFPNSGAKMRTLVHEQNMRTSSNAYDRPAVETQQPGYRRRG